jgi:hypothetical protein
VKIDPVSRELLIADPRDSNGAQLPSGALVNLLNQLQQACTTLWQNGTTAQRPTDPVLSQVYFDTTLGYFVSCSTLRAGASAAVWVRLSPLDAAGVGLQIKEGANARMGIATLVAGGVTVSNTSVTANTRIFLTNNNTNAGAVGFLYVSTRTVGASFQIVSSNGADVSSVAWLLIEPA